MAGTFPPDYFAPDYFAPDYFGGEANGNAMSATIAGVAVVSANLTATEAEQASTRPKGGDDAPGHPGIAPKRVNDKPTTRKTVKATDLEAIYDKILGIAPEEPTPVQRKVIARVAKVVGAQTQELPPAEVVDFAAIAAKARALKALTTAYERMIDDEEEALIALLMAA